PGFGPVLLGAVAAVCGEELDADDRAALRRLIGHLEVGHRIPQPQVRHRFQTDTHGLARTQARLLGTGEGFDLEVDGDGAPIQMALAVAYAGAALPFGARQRVFDVIRKGLAWRGPVDERAFRHLTGDADMRWASTAFADPRLWALDVLGLDPRHD